MEEYTQITLDQWMQWKEDIRRKLEETAGNFVYIGYRLKQIRDSGMYDGAADIFEFAEKEYGLGKSTVSRFIAINERYSEGGNSLELKEEFKGFSSSKLAEMLTIPDSEIQLITEKTTIREIRELKSFNGDAEKGRAVAAGDGAEEAAGPAPEQKWTPLEKCLIDFFKDKKEVLNGVVMHLDADPAEYKQAAEMMAPSGQASHRKGIMFLFMYDWNIGVKYKLMTEPDPVLMSWMELLNAVYHIFGACGQEDVWGRFYGEPEKPQEEPNEAQQNKSVENALPAQSDQGLEESVATSQQENESEEIMDGTDEDDEENFGNDSGEMEQENTQKETAEKLQNGSVENAAPAQSDQGLEESVATSQQETVSEEIISGEDEEDFENDREETAGNEDAEVDGDEADCELSEEECESGTENGEYLVTAEKIKQEVREKAALIFDRIKENGDANHWRNIRHRLNNLSSYIEQLIRYLEMAEDEESEE